MRAGYRQPIYLAKLKKRDKQNAGIQNYKPIDSIQYDLMLFQESLHLKDQPRIDLPMTMRSTSMNRKPLGENSKILNQTVELRNVNFQNKKKLNGDPLSRSIAPIFQKFMFNKNNFELKNVHKTQASTKPKTKSITETCLNIIQSKNQSNELSYLKMTNPMTNTNISQTKTKTVVEKMRNSELKELILVKYNEKNLQNSEDKKKIYQTKIEQLQKLNIKNIEIIKNLQQVNHFHSSQNALLLQRIQHIQHEFDQLLVNNKSLKDLETTQEKTTETTVLKFFSENSSQTQQVLDNQIKQETFVRNKNHSSRTSLQLSNEDWVIRAKQLKNQLQLQKIHTFNLQASYKIQLQNQQIQWRQKVQAMQRQFQGLNKRYQRKCTEIKQKQQLINRLIQK